MPLSKLKILLCLTVCLMFLFAPFLLEIAPDGKAYAGGSRKGNTISGVTGGVGAGDNGNSFGYTAPSPSNDREPVSVPEPATMLLFGSGALGLAALGRKSKKK